MTPPPPDHCHRQTLPHQRRLQRQRQRRQQHPAAFGRPAGRTMSGSESSVGYTRQARCKNAKGTAAWHARRHPNIITPTTQAQAGCEQLHGIAPYAHAHNNWSTHTRVRHPHMEAAHWPTPTASPRACPKRPPARQGRPSRSEGRRRSHLRPWRQGARQRNSPSGVSDCERRSRPSSVHGAPPALPPARPRQPALCHAPHQLPPWQARTQRAVRAPARHSGAAPTATTKTAITRLYAFFLGGGLPPARMLYTQKADSKRLTTIRPPER